MGAEGQVSQEDFAKLMSIAEEAKKTAEEAKTAAEARQEVKDTVKEEGAAQGITIDDATATMIANATVAQLEERGAFSSPSEGAPPQAGTPATEPPVIPQEGELPPPPPPGEIEQEAFEPPSRKSIAERFQGK